MKEQLKRPEFVYVVTNLLNHRSCNMVITHTALKTWALSRHVCCKTESDMREMGQQERNSLAIQLINRRRYCQYSPLIILTIPSSGCSFAFNG